MIVRTQRKWRLILVCVGMLAMCGLCTSCFEGDSAGPPPQLEVVNSTASNVAVRVESMRATDVIVPGQILMHAQVPISAANFDRLVPIAHMGNGQIADIAWSPDSTTLAVASSAGLFLYDAQTLAQKTWIRTTTDATTVAYASDGHALAAADNGGTVYLWNLQDSTPVQLIANTSSISDVAFTPDGTLLAVAVRDGTVQLWRVTDHTLVETIHAKPADWTDRDDSIDRIMFSDDGQLLAIETGRDDSSTVPVSRQKSVVIWHRVEQKSILTLDDVQRAFFLSNSHTFVAQTPGNTIYHNCQCLAHWRTHRSGE